MSLSSSQKPLWTLEELISATGGRLDGDEKAGPVQGISIDTRTIEAGDLFVALTDVRDGHEFVSRRLSIRGCSRCCACLK